VNAVFPPIQPGRKIVGYRPKTGRPVDDQGRIILMWIYE